MSLQNESDHKTESDSLWTVEDVANFLKYKPETVRTMSRDGRLPGFKAGKEWRYHKLEVYKWFSSGESYWD
jgi:excisionase family DNA binding protein